MEQVFGYFDYVGFEVYEGVTHIRWDKPRGDGVFKIVVIDRMVWVYCKDASGQYIPDLCSTEFAIYQKQYED